MTSGLADLPANLVEVFHQGNTQIYRLDKITIRPGP